MPLLSSLRFAVFFTLILIASGWTGLNAQETKQRLRSVGIGYYGELGLHPGLQGDITLLIADNSTRRYKWRKLLFRPSAIYFRRQFYSNNFIIMPQLVSQIGAREIGETLLYFEVSGKVGYHRYQYIGDQYISTPTGIQSVKRGGGNGVVYGLGFLLGIKSRSDRYYSLSMDYLNEKTEDTIRPKLIAIKLGVRFGCKQGEKETAK